MLDCAELCEAFTFTHEKHICAYMCIYVQFEGMFYQQDTIMGILMGTNCAPLIIADLFLFCYERDLCLIFTSLNSTTL